MGHGSIRCEHLRAAIWQRCRDAITCWYMGEGLHQRNRLGDVIFKAIHKNWAEMESPGNVLVLADGF